MNKRTTAPILATIALLSFAGSVQAAELAINGGFETGDFTGWDQFPGPGSQSITSDNPASGTFAANLVMNGSPNASLIKNSNMGMGFLTPGQEVTISFDMRGTTEVGGVVFAELFSEIDGGGVSQSKILGGEPLFGTPDWTTYVFTTTVGPDVSGGITLQLGAVCSPDAACVSNVFFDNVSVTAVPVPAAVWLFASALGLLGVSRRKAS